MNNAKAMQQYYGKKHNASMNNRSSTTPSGDMMPLEELRNSITRMEYLVEYARSTYLQSQGVDNYNNSSSGKHKRRYSKGGSGPGRDKHLSGRGTIKPDNSSISVHVGNEFDATPSNGDKGYEDDSNERKRQQQHLSERGARYIPFESKHEEEMVELLRRVAELVVRGEQRAASQNSNSASSNNDRLNANGSSVNIAIFEHFCERNTLSFIVNIVTGAAFHDIHTRITLTHPSSNNTPSSSTTTNINLVLLPPLSIATQAVQSISILIQNVIRATSLYFLLSNNRVNDLINLPLELYHVAEYDIMLQSQYQRQLLSHSNANTINSKAKPKQSTKKYSKNINNAPSNNSAKHRTVSANSLSGNRNSKANEIAVPRQMFATLENMHAHHAHSNPNYSNLYSDQSAEMSELTTHFISFLKSLAMRMNAETLQFFLAYPDATQQKNNSDNNNIDDDIDNPNIELSASTKSSIQFPLYARALHFCDQNQESFVRLTAMNICLNTLRLATFVDEKKGDDEVMYNSNGDESKSDSERSSVQSAVTMSKKLINGSVDAQGNVRVDDDNGQLTNSGSLDKTRGLPFRERLAIAQHVCQPSRVETLVSPIFIKLAQVCGNIEEAMRELDRVNHSIALLGLGSTVNMRDNDGLVGNDMESVAKREKENQNLEKKRIVIVRNFRNAVGDLQDELLLLEDVLKVGLTSLNEQVIEMMLTTFIYPLLLQPLHLFMQRYQALPSPTALNSGSGISSTASNFGDDSLNNDGSSTQSVQNEDGNNKKKINSNTRTFLRSEAISKIISTANSSHPFALMSTSESLGRSGLVDALVDDNSYGSIEGDIGDACSIPLNPSQTDHVTDSNLAGSAAAAALVSSPLVNTEPNSSPAKTTLFGIASIFHIITHKPLLHLLLTALYHPLAPEISDGSVISRRPEIVVEDDSEGSSNDAVRIRVDDSSPYTGSKMNQYQSENYKFGKDLQTRSTSGGNNLVDIGEKVTFVLSPALSEVFEGAVCGTKLKNYRTKLNPYRRALLACLSGTDGMSALQSLAVYTLDSIVSSLNLKVLNDVLFGASMDSLVDSINSLDSSSPSTVPSTDDSKPRTGGKQKKRNTNEPGTSVISNKASNYMVEVVASMCASVMTASMSEGVWKMNFNLVASHAILCSTMVNESAKATASKLIDHRRRQSASFLSQLPSRLDAGSLTASDNDHNRGEERVFQFEFDDHQMNVIMDRIFFDPLCDEDKCVVEHLVLKREQLIDGYWNGPGYVSVVRESNLDDLCDHICNLKDITTFRRSNTSYRCGASSAVAHIRLDAFSMLLKDNDAGCAEEKAQCYTGAAALARFDPNILNYDKDMWERTLTPLSSVFNELLFYDKEGITSLLGNPDPTLPRTGSVVTLVGKAAFPCVCEVAEESNSLFTDKSACVISEGVKWQSLYLVLLGKYMILAEPEKGGSGGNGRVITSCRLSCLQAAKDDPTEVETASPARRLLLTHSSPNPKPPGVFTLDKSGSTYCSEGPHNEVWMTHSHMDLWFEDAIAAGHAFKVLSSKIARARSRRGHKIREALAREDRIRFSSLFSGR